MPRLRAVVLRIARWVAREARELYRALPGPRWVKLVIVGVCLILLPGPFDEVILLAVVGVLRVRRARRARLPA